MPTSGLQVLTRYTSYTHLDSLLTRCPCWLASTANQSGLMTLTFHLLTLKVISRSRVTWATSLPILVFLGLSFLDLGPMYATDTQASDRQKDVTDRQTSVSIIAICPAYQERGHNKLQAGGRHNMPPTRPASADTIYIIHASGCVTNSMSMLACQYSQPKRSGDL